MIELPVLDFYFFLMSMVCILLFGFDVIVGRAVVCHGSLDWLYPRKGPLNYTIAR